MKGLVSRDLDFLGGTPRRGAVNGALLLLGALCAAAAFHHESDLQQRSADISRKEQSLRAELRTRTEKAVRKVGSHASAGRELIEFSEKLCHPWANILAGVEGAASEIVQEGHGSISIVAFEHDGSTNAANHEAGALTLEADTDQAAAAHGFADDLAAMPGIGEAQITQLVPNAGAAGSHRLRFRIAAHVERTALCGEPKT